MKVTLPRPMLRTAVYVLDQEYMVHGYGGEGWFDLLCQRGRAEGLQGYNVEALRTLVTEPDAVCLDVGANLGLVTLALSQLAPQGKVYAFEPDEMTYDALCATVAEAKAANVTTLPWVVGRENVTGDFVVDAQWRSSCHFIPRAGGTSKMQSIDSMDLDRVDLIKIDVEGSELDVLAGAWNTIADHRATVVAEFNSFALVYYRNYSPRAVLKEMCDRFPRVRYYDRTNNMQLTDLKDREAFLRANLLTGFVDDLVCTWEEP